MTTRGVASHLSVLPRRFFHPLSLVALGGVLACCASQANAADFVKPTAEELSMTSLPGYPGAPAVILYREDITKDDLHSRQHYERVKILSEEGKKYANVELGYWSTGGGFLEGDSKSLDDITGRTIHPDGTVIPFTGKPYLKVLVKADGFKVQKKVFTLPDVEVGSIIEYRYVVRISDHYFESPTWMIQDDLFVKEAHFSWAPTTRELVDEDEKPINSISWFPVLPPGAKIETHLAPTSTASTQSTSNVYELRVKNVPPRVKEEHMPPIASFSYRVNFSFTPYRTQAEYWTAVGKQWSKRVNNFATQNAALKEATAKATAGAATPEEKLQKIYATVMALENTDYTREHDRREDKASGMGPVKDAADVLQRGRGSADQLAEVFVGMARAAGVSAHAMKIPNRAERLFTPLWMSTEQLDDVIAVVTMDGKDRFFDPGARYCSYAQLAWQHTAVEGLRQTDSGATLGRTPFYSYKTNKVTRVANLSMDAHGEVSGKVDLTFTGSPALHWRQQALRGDDEEMRKELRESAENMLPKTLELEVDKIGDLKEYDKPLAVSFKVKGGMGNSVGKRVMLPVDVFLANESATFPHEARTTAVYFEYPEMVQDAVRVNLPQELAVEALPSAGQFTMPEVGAYALQATQAANSFTIRRDFIRADVVVLPKDYGTLRTFYSQLESKDQESVLLKKAAPASASATVPAPPAN